MIRVQRPFTHQFKIVTRRLISVVVSAEVQQAIAEKRPVVSLESTIITHGLPFPQNVSMARDVEATIRAHGAVPATCAFIDGVPHVGLSENQITRLAESPNVNKVSRRDIGVTIANKLNGGTTIALTMILSHKAGIKVFATGGLGGVHKHGEVTMDVSADLTELGRTPVAVVCAGPKAILDIPRTLEYLETQGVFVGTYNDDGRPNIEVPGFYCRGLGVRLPYSFSLFEEPARIINSSAAMGLTSGSLLCVPPPREHALDSDFIHGVIEKAQLEADKQGVKGKELTPFLLAHIARETQGKSVECNIQFVLNNARAAAKIAKALVAFEGPESTGIKPSTRLSKAHLTRGSSLTGSVTYRQPQSHIVEKADIVVVGSIALDSTSTLSTTVMGDSNPGATASSIGGVGHNVSLAAKYATKERSHVRLVSVVGDDLAGRSLLSQLKDSGFDVSGIKVETGTTAQYTSIHKPSGDLMVACADMSIVEQDFSEHIASQIRSSMPSVVVLDCNLSPDVLGKTLHLLQQEFPSTKVIVEPTSAPKAARIGGKHLRVWPHHTISMATPTATELDSMFSAFSSQELFSDYDEWFPLVDSLGLDASFRDLVAKIAALKPLVDQGVLQQLLQILPYIPNLAIKLGAKGVLSVSINRNVSDYKSIPTTSPFAPETITSKGRRYTENGESKTLGVVVQYYPIPKENENLTIKNVTGAGDLLVGYLAASPSEWMDGTIESVEQEWAKWEAFNKAQVASGLLLQHEGAISPKIRDIK